MHTRMPNPFLGINNNINVKLFTESKPTGKVSKGTSCGNNGTHIVIVLDESSSMGSCYSSTVSGFNEYIDTQKKVSNETNEKAVVTVVKFNGHNVDKLWSEVDINEIPDLKDHYSPSGMTNLLDAVGVTMENVDKSLKAKKKKNRPNVFFVIFTDGEENSSRTFNNEMIKQMVKNREQKEWAFTFLGANIDAFSVGSSFGMSQANTVQYDTNNMGNTFEVLATATTTMRSMKAKGFDTQAVYASMYSDDDRKKTMGDK